MSDLFIVRFVTANIILGMVLLFFRMIKRFTGRKLDSRTMYRISTIALLFLVLPLISSDITGPLFLSYGREALASGEPGVQISYLQEPALTAVKSSGWSEEFILYSGSKAVSMLNKVVFAIWMAGVLLSFMRILIQNRLVQKWKRDAKIITDRKILSIFLQNCEKLNISRNIKLCYSDKITTPVLAGMRADYLLLPESVKTLEIYQLKYILLHELYHHKCKHNYVNLIMSVMHSIYWFHPVVHLFIKDLRTEMELSCDVYVMDQGNEEEAIFYGETILLFLKQQETISHAVIGINSSGMQMKKRIEAIVSFHKEEKQNSRGSIIIMTAVCLLMAACLLIQPIFVNADGIYKSDKTNIIYEETSKYFTGYGGSFVLYDMAADTYVIQNPKDALTRTSPASTYKIYSLLGALEQGIVSQDDSELAWEGEEYYFEQWNKDHDMFSAMNNSVNWYFQELDRSNGLKNIQSLLGQIGYGNQDLSGGIEEFWLGSSLKISPLEQVEILAELYQGEYAVKQENIEVLKEVLFLEDNNGISLYGKTGTHIVNTEKGEGWFVGLAETEDNTYVFAVHLTGDNELNGSAAVSTALQILTERGIY